MNNTTTNSQPLDKKSFWIGISLLLCAILVAANVIPEQQALAAESVDGRDYAMATALAPDGSDVLYVLDKRTGQLAVLEWDAQAKLPAIRDMQPIQTAFN